MAIANAINKELPNGDIVGTTDVQILTNKTIDGDDNTILDIDVSSLADQTAGDVLIWDVAGAPATLAAGSNGDVLTIVGGLPVWQAGVGSDTNFANTDLTATGNRSHTFDADDLAIGFTTGQLEFTLADGASTATSTSTSTSLSNSVVAGANSGTVEVTSAGIDLSFAGTSDLKLDSSAGAAGQLLTSGGAGAAPTWTTVSVTDTNFANTDLTATGNRSHTFDANNLEIGFTTGNLDFTLSSGGQSSQIAAEAAGLDFSSASGADSTNLNVTSNQIDLSFGGAADFKVDGSAGLAGQLLTSSGPGSAPTWTTVSVTDTNFANTDLTSTGNRTHTFDADDLDIDFTTGVLQFSFSSGTASGLISGTSAGVVLTGADGGNSASLIASSSDLNLTFSGTSDLKINSSAGTVGQLLTSSGPGVAPTWTTVGVTDTNFANTDLTSTGNRAHTFDADNLGIEFTSGQLSFEFVNGTDAANIGAEADEFQVAIASGTSTAELSVDPNGSTFSNADPSGGAEIELSPTGMDLSFAGAGDLKLDGASGNAGQFLTSGGAGVAPTWTNAGGGTIGGTTGPVDNALIRADGGGGSTIQASNVILDDSDNLTGVNDLTVINQIDVGGSIFDTNGIDLGVGDDYGINGTVVLDATSLGNSVVDSNLQSLGTVTTGTWEADTIGTQYGGTGLTSYVPGDLIYAAGPTSLTTRSIGSPGDVLTVNPGTVPVWQSPATPVGITQWAVTVANTTLAASDGIIANTAAQLVATLPTTSSVGDTYELLAYQAVGFRVAQNAGQTIRFGNQFSTAGVTGYLESTAVNDSVRIICVQTNVQFAVVSSIGNLTLN